jgi:transcriptional regulator of arginine metabolism
VPGSTETPQPIGLLRRLLDEFAMSVARTSAGLVVRTPPGAAAALAEGIDRAAIPEIAGTIAGDNTILILGREGVRPARLEALLDSIREGTR